VSFYFDDRIERLSDAAQLRAKATEHIVSTGESVVAALTTDRSRLEVVLACGEDDLEEFFEDLKSPSLFFAGLFPGSDNDGTDAVTIVLPDLDGVVRRHPH
jgi:hypothetical protein